MEQLLEFCHRVFDRSPIAFAVARVYLDEEGTGAADIGYVYLNAAMADLTSQRPDDLTGQTIYGLWPDGDRTWLPRFYRTAYEGQPLEFDAVSDILEEFQHIVVFPILRPVARRRPHLAAALLPHRLRGPAPRVRRRVRHPRGIPAHRRLPH